MGQDSSTTGKPTPTPALPPELAPLLRRFGEALGVVVGGLAQFDDQNPTPAGHDSGQDVQGTAIGPIARAAELVELLDQNNMRAERVIAEIRAAWQGPEPSWLASAARAINALDYSGAIATLRAAGAIGPATG